MVATQVVLVDNDCIMMRNIDHLAEVPAPAAAWHAGMCEDSANCFFNSGVMVLKPDASEMARLISYYNSLTTRHEKGRQAPVVASATHPCAQTFQLLAHTAMCASLL